MGLPGGPGDTGAARWPGAPPLVSTAESTGTGIRARAGTGAQRLMELILAVLTALVKSIVVFFVLILAAAYSTLLERKELAWMTIRIGPNRVGPKGLLQPISDAVKAIFKEDSVPQGADKVLFWIAPAIAMIASMFSFVVIPFGPRFELFGFPIDLQIADVSVGVLVLLAVS